MLEHTRITSLSERTFNNAESTLWGADRSSSDGNFLADLCSLAGLGPLPSPIPTRGSRYIDVLLASFAAQPDISRCSDRLDFVSHPKVLSDHIPIGCTIANPSNPNNPKLVWNLRNADWEAYRTLSHLTSTTGILIHNTPNKWSHN